MVFLMHPRITVRPFGESMQFIPYRRSRAETSIFTISESLGKMRHSKRVPKTSCVIRWEEGSGADETVGAITAKRWSIALRPQVGATAGIANGNHGGSRSTLGTFNPLFPTGFYFGQGGISLLGPLNLFEVGPHVSLQLTRSLSVVADDHTFWRTSLQDGVYGLGINLLVSGQGNSGRYIGNQPSVGVYWNAGRHLSVSTAYAHFLVGTFLAKASPPGRDVDYAAVSTTYKF